MYVKSVLRLAYRKLYWTSRYMPTSLRHRIGAFYRARTETPASRKAPETIFVNALNTKPLRPEVILYESFHGSSMNCSPRAMFDALLADPDQRDLEHVWCLTKTGEAPESLQDHPNVSFVKSGSTGYAEQLATAGTIVSNSTLPTWYIRRSGQSYVNTWHGVPLKKMFKHEDALRPTVHRNSQRNFLQASHIVLQNDFTADALLDAADVAEATAGRLLCTGAPRVDATLNTDREALRRELGLTDGQKLIFIAPTWRGELGKTAQKAPMLEALLTALNALPDQDYAVFVQMHNFAKTKLPNARTLPRDMSTNRFLAAVDVLISDYSSIMFDYMATGRQLILYVYDRAEYEELRGLNAPLETLPAQLCMRPKEVIDAILSNHPADALPQFTAARDKFFPLEDGQATTRALAALTDVPPRQRLRPRIAFFGGGWKNNGITSSLLNLLNALQAYDLDIYVLTEGQPLEKSDELRTNLRHAGARTRLLHRAGAMPRTPAENSQLERFYAGNGFADPEHEAAVMALFQREARRLVGDMDFDAAVDFSGYARYWSLLIAMLTAKRHTIYQHNDMCSEAEKRFDVLNGVFATYKWYDSVASVSDETRRVNADSLAPLYATPQAAVTVRNVIRPDRIRQLAAEPLPDHFNLPQDKHIFVMAGRLSPEKAQDRAIRALGQLRASGTDAALVLMGTGPLEDHLKSEARACGVEDLVIFAGHVSNPFPVIARGSCFLLSSDYEGQPMVLLEALTLGKPVIATDIPGARSVLGDAHGHLVPPSAEGVATGMRHFMSGKIVATDFDAEKYCDMALQDFFDKVLDFTPNLLPEATS
ncbi:glycosyltransferase [Phaeobacter inhibens]|uniref:glycosyltransferase n=1 Tax=Phaeobacter inhibens TaxID=221822 RepID=UPI000C9A38C0|nr:glycosyltransferase [Phaeobacter inhibens]AUQ68769.1 putative glycosyl transferase [Phaeobacter inhibens]